MPPRALRPCRATNCRATTRDASGYCDACRPAAEAKDAELAQARDKRRGTSSQRGYGSDWQKLRARIMRAHGGLCQDCKTEGFFRKAFEVHHADGSAQNNEFSNLIPLCREHHDKRHGVVGGRRVRLSR